MPSGPKKRRAARRRRRQLGTNTAEDDLEDARELSESLSKALNGSSGGVKAQAIDENGSEESQHVDQISLESPPLVKSENVEKVLVMESVITGEESSDSVGNKEKAYESEPVDQILIQPDSKDNNGNKYAELGEGSFHGPMEIIDSGISFVKQNEEVSTEGVLQDPFEESTQVPEALLLQEAQDLSIPIKSGSEVNVVKTFIEDARGTLVEPPESSNLTNLTPDHEGDRVEVGEIACHGSSSMVKDVVSVEDVGQDSYEEPTETVKTIDQSVLKKIRVKEDQEPSVSTEVDLETTSFEDAQEIFVTPLGSPSVAGYMSNRVIHVNEAQDPYLAAESLNEVNAQLSLNEDDVQGNEVAKVGESASHKESVLKKDEDVISMESILEAPLEELLKRSSYEPVIRTNDQVVTKEIILEEAEEEPSVVAESVIEANVETFSKDANDSLEEVVEGKGCDVGECACDYPLINHVVSEGEKISMEGVCEEPSEKNSHEPEEEEEEMVEVDEEKSSKDDQDSYNKPHGSPDTSPVEGFSQFYGHGNGPTGLSSHEQNDDVSFVEGVVPGEGFAEVGDKEIMVNLLSVLKDGEDVPMEDVENTVNEPNEHSSDEIQETHYQEILLKDVQDTYVPAKSVSEADIEPFLKNAQEYSFKAALGNEYDKVAESETFVGPFVLGMEDDDDMSIDGVVEEPFEPEIMVKKVDQSALKENQEAFVPGESFIEVNAQTSLKEVQDSLSPDEGVVQGEECAKGHNATMVNDIDLVMEEKEEMFREGFLEEPYEELNESEVIIKTVDQSVLKDAQDISLSTDSVIEVNVDTSLEDSGSPSMVDVLPIEAIVQGNEIAEVGENEGHGSPVLKKDGESESSMEGVVQDPLEDPTRDSLHEIQEIAKAIDQLVLKGLHLKNLQDSSVTEVNVETSFEEDQDSPFQTPLGSPSEGRVSPIEGFTEWNEEIGQSSHEPQMAKTYDQVVLKVIDMEETQKPSLPPESIIEADVETSSLKDAKNTSIDPIESFSLADVSSMEGVVQGNEYDEVGESSSRGLPVVSVDKEGENISLDGIHQDSFEDKIGDSSHEAQENFKVDDQSVLKVVSLIKVQDPSVSAQSVIEANVQTSSKEAQDSYEESLASPSLNNATFNSWNVDLDGYKNEAHVMVKTVDEVRPSKEEGEDHLLPVESVIEDNVEISSKDAQYSFKESLGSSVEGKDMGGEDAEMDKQMSIKDFVEEPFEEAQDPSLPVEPVIEVNVETSFKDSQDALEEPLLDVESRSKGIDQGNEFAEVDDNEGEEMSIEGVVQYPFEEPFVMVKTVDQVVLKEIDTEETQEPYLPPESVIEANIDTSLKDAKESSIDSLGSFSFADVASMQGKECAKVGERSFHDEVVSMEGSLEKPSKDPNEPSSDELTKTDFEANVETSLKDNQDSLKDSPVSASQVDVPPNGGIIQEKEFNEGGENATTVNQVESLKKEHKGLSFEYLLDDKPDGDSSHEQEEMVNHVVPVVKESEGMSLDSSSLVNGSRVDGVGQRNGQRNELVGLVRTLLEEIRRIRAFYEEGLRQTTQIHVRMSEVLENFDSDQLI